MSFCSIVNQQFTAQYYTSACTEYQQYVMIFKWKCAFLGETKKHKKNYLQCATIESPSILWVTKDKTYKDTLMNKQMQDGTPKCPLVKKPSNNTDHSSK